MIRPDNRLFVGRGGSGKSTLALYQSRAFERVVILDPNAEDAHAAGGDVCVAQAALPAMMKADRFRVVWRGMATMDPAAAFEWANRCAWSAENCLVMWEEADLYLAAHRPPEWAYKIVHAGRHRGVGVFACTRRPARVPRDLTALCTRMAIFATTEPRDLAYLREYIGQPADRLSNLGRFEALDWTEAGCRVRQAPYD